MYVFVVILIIFSMNIPRIVSWNTNNARNGFFANELLPDHISNSIHPGIDSSSISFSEDNRDIKSVFATLAICFTGVACTLLVLGLVFVILSVFLPTLDYLKTNKRYRSLEIIPKSLTC